MTGNGGNIVQKELNETVVRSREEIEERLETEDRQQLGDISDEVYARDTPTPEFHLRVPQGIRVYAHSLSRHRASAITAKRSRCLFLQDSSHLIARALVSVKTYPSTTRFGVGTSLATPTYPFRYKMSRISRSLKKKLDTKCGQLLFSHLVLKNSIRIPSSKDSIKT